MEGVWWRRGGRLHGLRGLGEGVVGGRAEFTQGLVFQLTGHVQEVGAGLFSVVTNGQGVGVCVLQLLGWVSVGVWDVSRVAFSLEHIVNRALCACAAIGTIGIATRRVALMVNQR